MDFDVSIERQVIKDGMIDRKDRLFQKLGKFIAGTKPMMKLNPTAKLKNFLTVKKLRIGVVIVSIIINCLSKDKISKSVWFLIMKGFYSFILAI